MHPDRPTEHSHTLGRKRDHTRDQEILDATLDVLAETGYDGMTIDMVAARAKAGKATVYRRWSSKPELVLEAVAGLKSASFDVTTLPDTGTLRGDLVAMIQPPSIKDGEHKLQIMAGIVSIIARSPELADAAHEALVEPRAAVYRIIFQRAIERGEISSTIDVERLCTLGPALFAYRVLMLGQHADREFMLDTIDNVILPAAGLCGHPG